MSSRITESRPPDVAWTEQERELLAAAREDRMPAALEARLRDVLEFPAAHQSGVGAGRSTFNDSGRMGQLFVGKLPLWGVLGIAVIAAVSYYALVSAARFEAGPKGSPRQEVTRGEASAPGWTVAQQAKAGSTHAAGPAAEDREPVRAAAAGPASAQPDVATARRGSGKTEPDRSADEAGGLRAHVRSRPAEPRKDAVATKAPPPLAARVAPRMPGGAHSPTPAAQSMPAADSGNASSADQLRLEAELLQHARSALGQGALSEARRWLARYHSQFARGALQPESQVLGIELNVRTGARSAAKTQADRFISQHPDHPLRDRVQQLTADP